MSVLDPSALIFYFFLSISFQINTPNFSMNYCQQWASKSILAANLITRTASFTSLKVKIYIICDISHTFTWELTFKNPLVLSIWLQMPKGGKRGFRLPSYLFFASGNYLWNEDTVCHFFRYHIPWNGYMEPKKGGNSPSNSFYWQKKAWEGSLKHLLLCKVWSCSEWPRGF